MSAHEVKHKQHVSSPKPYLVGFLISIILTLAAYYLVTLIINGSAIFSTAIVLYTIMAFAFVQLVVQLYFFLHLGREPKYNWNLFFFISTAGVIFLMITASIWIMNHLNYNMMANPTEMMNYIKSQNTF